MNASPGRFEIHIPWSTIFRLLVAALIVACLIKLWPEAVFLLLSLLLAVALEPIVSWAEQRRMPRGSAVLILAFGLLAVGGAVVMLAAPPLVRQFANVVEQLPSFRERLLAHLASDSLLARNIVERVSSLPTAHDVGLSLSQTLLVGLTTISGMATTFFVIISTLYLLLDGKRLYAWLLAYVPRTHRPRVAATIPEVSMVITAYVRGQAVTSALFGLFAALLLHVCHVPAALPLAVFAAACDVIPVVGVIIAVAPAMMLGLTVSPLTAAIVFLGYVLYHLLEAYVIVPKIYGSTLRISTLAVLLALLVGTTLQGLLGAVLILPIVAAYPIIERIWLKDYLGADVLHDHHALARAAEMGSDSAVEAVLKGIKHPEEPSRLRLEEGHFKQPE
jgi:predicted PurR-regulated permease PerM